MARTQPVSAPVQTCTRHTRRCDDARDYKHALRECCRTHVREITTRAAVALRAAGVTFWADYGTLLGAVRNPMTTWADYPWLHGATGPLEPGIIPHDKDSDFGVLHKDWNAAWRAMRQLAGAHGYNLVVNASRGSMKLRLSRVNHTNLDLFFWRERPNGRMYRTGYAQVDAFKGKEFPRTMLEPLVEVPWEGITLPAPADPAAFLAMRYGPNWRTPIAANNDGVRR